LSSFFSEALPSGKFAEDYLRDAMVCLSILPPAFTSNSSKTPSFFVPTASVTGGANKKKKKVQVNNK
jgi:hypothetical protein